MAGFIDTMRAEGYAAWSICRVLREQGCQVAARTYRAWRRAAPAVRTITETQVIDAVRPRHADFVRSLTVSRHAQHFCGRLILGFTADPTVEACAIPRSACRFDIAC